MRPRVPALPLLLASACRSGLGFAPTLPPELPDIRGWERSEGVAEFQKPRGSLAYELYVNPARPGVYSVTRYRVTAGDAAVQRAAGGTSNEKLQWDRDGRDVRRYECEAETARDSSCRWRELPRGSAEYDRELTTLLSVYALHAALLRERELQGGR